MVIFKANKKIIRFQSLWIDAAVTYNMDFGVRREQQPGLLTIIGSTHLDKFRE